MGSDELVCRRWTVRGRVQAVGFRWFVLTQAQLLGARGWVRNTPDGAVEVVALASAGTVTRLKELVSKGPPGSRVSECLEDDLPHEAVPHKSFIIMH